MPVPFTDVTAAMRLNAERTETALQKVSVICFIHSLISLFQLNWT